MQTTQTAQKLTVSALLITVTVLSAQPPVVTDYWRVTPWDYWAATPAYMQMCSSSPTGHCYSVIVFPDRHMLDYQENGPWSVERVLPNGGVGVVRDYSPGSLRCFSDVPGSCWPSSYPPGYSPAVDYVPVLAQPGTSTPTPGAQVYYSLQTTQVNAIDPTTCAVSFIGSEIHSGAHFVLTTYDFGPPLGVLANVYVTEEALAVPIGAANPMWGQRLERYFFAPGMGRVHQEGWNDPACGTDPATCLGNYSVPAPTGANWIPSGTPPPVLPQAVEICP